MTILGYAKGPSNRENGLRVRAHEEAQHAHQCPQSDQNH